MKNCDGMIVIWRVACCEHDNLKVGNTMLRCLWLYIEFEILKKMILTLLIVDSHKGKY